MAELDKLIAFNKPEKLNRRIRLEDKLRQQENYGDIEELFDPLTKTLNTHNEQNLAWGLTNTKSIRLAKSRVR